MQGVMAVNILMHFVCQGIFSNHNETFSVTARNERRCCGSAGISQPDDRVAALRRRHRGPEWAEFSIFLEGSEFMDGTGRDEIGCIAVRRRDLLRFDGQGDQSILAVRPSVALCFHYASVSG